MFLPGGVSVLLARQTAIHADDLHPVAGFAFIHQIVVHNDIHGSRQLSGGRLFRHLLNGERLMIHVDGQSVLRDERVVVLVFGRIRGRRRKRLQRSQVRVFTFGVFFRRRTIMDGLNDFRVDERSLGDDAFDADHVADVSRRQTARCHVLPSERPFEAHVESPIFGVDGVGRSHDFLQRPLTLHQVSLIERNEEKGLACRKR